MEKLLTENFWRSTNGPYSEIVYSIVVNPYNQHIFCGTFGSGILKSTPYGSYWSQTTISKIYIPSIIVSPEKIIFAGTRENGIFRSIDNGVTWNGTSLRKITINSLSYDSDNYIYAGTFNNGIFFSKNSGVSWNQLISNNVSCYKIFIDSKNNIFAITDDGVIFSSDKGSKWEKRNNGLESLDIKDITGSNDTLFLATSNYIYISNNLGKSWNKLNLIDHDIFNNQENSNSNLLFMNNKIWSLLLTEKNGLVIGTENGVFYTNDFYLYKNISSGLRSKKVYSLSINNDGFLFAGTYGWGVFKSQKSFYFK